jgi:hypothetical protein
MTNRLNRKSLFLATVTVVLFCAFFIWQNSNPTSNAQSIGIEYIFDFVPDAATLATLPATGSTFYIQGKMYPFRTVNQATCEFNRDTAKSVGTWRAWGTVADEGRLVLDLSLIGDFGTIELQGVTGVLSAANGATPAVPGTLGPPFTGPTELLSIVGGTGAYKGLNGEGQVRSYCSDPTRPFRYDRPFCIQFLQACCTRKGT